MTELIVEGQRVRVSDDFLRLSPEEQERTVEEIAASLPQRGPALSQLNLGIADTLGGLVDLINPFDTPAVSQALGLGDRLTTGSAREGLVSGMQTIGAAGEDRPPEGLLEAGLRGGGQAVAAAGPFNVVAQGASRLPGIAGNVAGQLARSTATTGAVAAEAAAGAASGAAMEAAEEAGLPDWAVGLAGVAAPVGLAGGVMAGQAGLRAAGRVSPVNNAVRATVGAVAPYTRRGAEAVARRRMDELAGSRERALELGERINPNDEFGLTPAQQTGDSRFIALEQAARDANPVLDATIEERLGVSINRARGAVDEIGGDVSDAQTFFREERARYTTELRAVADQALRNADTRLRNIRADRDPGQNSAIVMEEIERARDVARGREEELWSAVPRADAIGTGNARARAQALLDDTPRAQAGDFPQIANDLLLGESGLGENTSVMELHGLYSRLRQIAREASSGPAPNENRARIANQIAEAILDDLGAREGTDAVGRAINTARAFSRSLHETFDQGAYGRLSRQTVQGDTVTDPRVALDRSVGRGGTGAMVDAENLEGAARGVPDPNAPPPPNARASEAIVDYVRGLFEQNAFTPEGTLTRAGALRFVRNNRELLQAYPELRTEIMDAADRALSAEQVDALITRTIEVNNQLPVSRLADATQEQAIRSILDAEDPLRAAQDIRAAAQRDETGAAMDGVKAVFSDELIRRATRTDGGLDAERMAAVLREPRFRATMSRILDPAEIRRVEQVARVLGNINMAETSQGALPGRGLSGAQVPRMIEALARIVAVRNAPSAGDVRDLQTSAIVSGNAVALVNRLTTDRASRILADAITDPRLFQALLMDPASPRFEREALPRLLPYLVGGGAAATVEDEPAGPLRMELTDPGNQRLQ